MNDKKNLVIALLVIVLAIVAYLLWADTDGNPQDTANTQNGQNNIIAEPPPPAPAPNPSPSGSQGPDEVSPAPSQDKVAGTSWLLTGLVVDGNQIAMNFNVPQAMTLNFDKSKKLTGFSGCNSFSGGYTLSGADKFDFTAVASTKKYCVESSTFENKLLEAMSGVTNYQINAEGNLVLTGMDGKAEYKIEYKPAI